MGFPQKVARTIAKHSPAILTGLGVLGVFATAILASEATLEAADRIRDVEGRSGTAGDARQRIKERVEMVWPLYIPTVLSATATAACIIGTHGIHNRRHAALLSVYSLTEVAFREYKEKVVEQIGENKERKIREDIHQDHLNQNPVNTEVLITGKGEMLCYEEITGRYFKSDMETIRKAQNDINAQIIHDMYASHNQFCSLVGLPDTLLGEQIGWTTDNMMDISFSSMLATNGEPCLVIDYRMSPKSEYYKLNP